MAGTLRWKIPIVSIGADHAHEQINKVLKVQSGITGLSNRQQFFLASPEMAETSSKFKDQFGIHTNKSQEHLDVHQSDIKKENEAVDKIKSAILCHGNPFSEGDKLFNFFTQAYIPQEYADKHGQDLDCVACRGLGIKTTI